MKLFNPVLGFLTAATISVGCKHVASADESGVQSDSEAVSDSGDDQCPASYPESYLKKLCSNGELTDADDKKFFESWGANFCASMIMPDGTGQATMSCSYVNLLEKRYVNVAEALAIFGYTNEYYNYLNNRSKDGQVVANQEDHPDMDVFERVLLRALSKLSRVPSFQYDGPELYRGSSYAFLGADGQVFPAQRWFSTSCVREVSFGFETAPRDDQGIIERLRSMIDTYQDYEGINAADIHKFQTMIDDKLKQKVSATDISGQMIRAINDFIMEKNLDVPGIGDGEQTNIQSVRKPASVQGDTDCQREYFRNTPELPVNAGETFRAEKKITIFPLKKGKSKGVIVYQLSGRSEGEILFPPTTKFKVKSVRNSAGLTLAALILAEKEASAGNVSPPEAVVEYEEVE